MPELQLVSCGFLLPWVVLIHQSDMPKEYCRVWPCHSAFTITSAMLLLQAHRQCSNKRCDMFSHDYDTSAYCRLLANGGPHRGLADVQVKGGRCLQRQQQPVSLCPLMLMALRPTTARWPASSASCHWMHVSFAAARSSLSRWSST